jgi:putative ABC transport system substrate-binding protein
MTRLPALVALAVVFLAAPVAPEAQHAGKAYRVGIIFAVSPVVEMAGPEPAHPAMRAFVHGLREQGLVEGHNLALERRSAEGRYERFAEIVAELVRLKIDVIVTTGNTMAARAKEVTSTVPLVMAAVMNPIEQGLVQGLARPGGNVTGLSLDAGPELEAKRLALLKETVPGAKRVAFLGQKRRDWATSIGESVRVGARALGLELFLAEPSPNDYVGAFALIERERPDAVFVAAAPAHYVDRRVIAGFMLRAKLPSVHASRAAVEVGALMSYAADGNDHFRRAARYVHKILHGAKAGDLPVEQPTKFELVINLKTARALGLTIPQSVLLQADSVIE